MHDIVLIQDSKCIVSYKSTADGYFILLGSLKIFRNLLSYVIYNALEQGYFHLPNTLNHSFRPIVAQISTLFEAPLLGLTERAQYQLKPKPSMR